jgi:O-antigen/teichoic acid export membrane protein
VWVFARESFHISTAFIFTALAARAPVIFGMALLGPAAAAVLEIASRFGTLGSVATSSVASTYATPLAQSAQAEDWARSSRLLKSAALLSFLGGLMAFLAIIIAFPMLTGPVIPAFYEAAYPSLILIGGATLVNSAFGLGSTFLLMVNKGATVRNFSALQLLMLLITGYFCGTLWGGVGIAIGCLVGSIARDAPLMFAAFRLIKAGRQTDSSGTPPTGDARS